MSSDYKSNFCFEVSCGMRWNVQDVVVTLNITMTGTVSHNLCAPCMLCVMTMAVVSIIALRCCYSEDGDRFCGILSLEDHSVNLHHHDSVVWGFADKIEVCKWH